jgi:putative metallohydrolase (TIGR04338 family)
VRDSQKQKVYDAERCMQIEPRLMRPYKVLRVDDTGPEPRRWIEKKPGLAMTLPECQAYVDKLLGSAYMQRKYGYRSGRPRKVNVKQGRGGGAACSPVTIELGVWARQPIVILHEIAHCLTWGVGADHGWEFTACLLDLVRHSMGKDAHDKLRASYDDHKVKYRQPRKRGPVSEEQRAVLVERLAAARTAKAASKEGK